LDKFIIKGGKSLFGSVKVGGAKNASLALIPSALLTSGVSKLYNTPGLNDVYTMLKLVRHLGADAQFENDVVTIDTTGVAVLEAPYEHVKKMRASVYVLGPLRSQIRLCEGIFAGRMCLGTKTN
jgi:UDP-N-acetylglucosamine 1-carboxyvinyltransferase